MFVTMANVPSFLQRQPCRQAHKQPHLLRKHSTIAVVTRSLRGRSQRCRSASGDASEGGQGDIDALARMLSQQAAKLRSSIGDEELRKKYDGFEDVPTSSTLGFQVRCRTHATCQHILGAAVSNVQQTECVAHFRKWSKLELRLT